ncbi:MAG: thioredoxin [Gammaproteobacteria bacterium]|nr:thioredoxin [Gammaproteobacteria bacterium]
MHDSVPIHTATVTDFDTLVIARSHERAVIVDFWAAWCSPCRALAPVLEQLASLHADALDVVKVDTDAEPVLAQRYGVRSLPTLLLFVGGQPLEQIVGAQPLGAIEARLAPHLPRASDRALADAAGAMQRGDREAAIAVLERALAGDPDNFRLHPPLAALLIDADDLDRAEAVLRALPANEQSAEAQRQHARLRLARAVAHAPDAARIESRAAAGDASSELRYAGAVRKLLGGDEAGALAQLLEIVRSDRAYGDDAARRTMLDAFVLLGEDHPLVRDYRTALARALH